MNPEQQRELKEAIGKAKSELEKQNKDENLKKAEDKARFDYNMQKAAQEHELRTRGHLSGKFQNGKELTLRQASQASIERLQSPEKSYNEPMFQLLQALMEFLEAGYAGKKQLLLLAKVFLRKNGLDLNVPGRELAALRANLMDKIKGSSNFDLGELTYDLQNIKCVEGKVQMPKLSYKGESLKDESDTQKCFDLQIKLWLAERGYEKGNDGKYRTVNQIELTQGDLDNFNSKPETSLAKFLEVETPELTYRSTSP